jgi:hypothetical protein
MMCARRFMLILASGLSLCLGSWSLADLPRQDEPEMPFHKEILKVAAEYKKWGRVDDEMRWAPGLCRSPNPGQVYISSSKDDDTHGKKLYSLFAKNRNE